MRFVTIYNISSVSFTSLRCIHIASQSRYTELSDLVTVPCRLHTGLQTYALNTFSVWIRSWKLKSTPAINKPELFCFNGAANKQWLAGWFVGSLMAHVRTIGWLIAPLVGCVKDLFLSVAEILSWWSIDLDHCVVTNIGVGDGGQRGMCHPPQKKIRKNFGGKCDVKFGHFVNCLGKYHVKFRNF